MDSDSAKKYYHRAARYVLQLKDNTIVRFAAFEKGSKKFQTRIINLSESGMAFLLPFLENPKVGEIIKIEFQVPSANAMACFARVLRIERHQLFTADGQKQIFKLVAVEFQDLPVAQRQMIRQGLAKEFEQIRKQQKYDQYRFRMQWLATRMLDGISNFSQDPLGKFKNLVKKKPKAIKKNKSLKD